MSRTTCYDDMRLEAGLPTPFPPLPLSVIPPVTEALSTLQRPCPHIQPRGQLTCSGLLSVSVPFSTSSSSPQRSLMTFWWLQPSFISPKCMKMYANLNQA